MTSAKAVGITMESHVSESKEGTSRSPATSAANGAIVYGVVSSESLVNGRPDSSLPSKMFLWLTQQVWHRI